MPAEQLVEANFKEYEEEDDIASNYFGETPSDTISCSSSSTTFTKRVLIEADLQKLMLAKLKLVKILELTESLNQKNNWK
jgi:hypothetical protein